MYKYVDTVLYIHFKLMSKMCYSELSKKKKAVHINIGRRE